MRSDGTEVFTGAFAMVPVVLAQNGRDDLDVGSILGYVLVGLVVGLLARLVVRAATRSDCWGRSCSASSAP